VFEDLRRHRMILFDNSGLLLICILDAKFRRSLNCRRFGRANEKNTICLRKLLHPNWESLAHPALLRGMFVDGNRALSSFAASLHDKPGQDGFAGATKLEWKTGDANLCGAPPHVNAGID